MSDERTLTLKTFDTPIGLDAAEIETHLKGASDQTDLSARIEHFSRSFLDRPYVEGSLGGGPHLPEEFRVSLAAFDCVTLVETVLALALARTTQEFIDRIRRIRYKDGEVDWFRRNHYMVDWAQTNEDQGFVSNLTTGLLTMRKTCSLNLIEGLPEKLAAFSYFPTEASSAIATLLQTGDLMLFVSSKDSLDVFHVGFLIESAGRWMLRHATRTAGSVIDQDLAAFINQNTMAGFVLLRPLCRL